MSDDKVQGTSSADPSLSLDGNDIDAAINLRRILLLWVFFELFLGGVLPIAARITYAYFKDADRLHEFVAPEHIAADASLICVALVASRFPGILRFHRLERDEFAGTVLMSIFMISAIAGSTALSVSIEMGGEVTAGMWVGFVAVVLLTYMVCVMAHVITEEEDEVYRRKMIAAKLDEYRSKKTP